MIQQESTRTFRITLTDDEPFDVVGRLKIIDNFIIVNHQDQNGPYVVFAAPRESLISVAVVE